MILSILSIYPNILLVCLAASALRVMFSSMNSPGQLTQWSANGDDPCGQNWKGIACSGSRVTEM